MAKTGPTEDYFRPQDLEWFKRAAKLFKVYIAVRRTNETSIKRYVGVDGYCPKLIDCKAKTAEFDVFMNGRKYETAGLVVDYDVFKGFHDKVYGASKVESARKAWEDFTKFGGASKLAPKSIYGDDGKSKNTIEVGYSYFTQMDPSHKHYGCLRWSPTNQARGGRYIHADYDLYAVIPVDDPSTNEFVQEYRLEEHHSRTPYEMDVQNFLTAHMPGMIAHGEQDTYKDDPNDDIDVFFPDGRTVLPFLGKQAISDLYRIYFRGRPMMGEGSVLVDSPRGGDWKMIKPGV